MRFGEFVALLFGAIALQVPLHAELPTKRVLTLDAAKTIAAAAEAEALKRGATVVIVVVDDGGHVVLLERLNDTQVASVDVGIGKARTAAIFRRPSKVFEDQIRDGRVASLALPGATPLQGGMPLDRRWTGHRRHRRQRQHPAGRRRHRQGRRSRSHGTRRPSPTAGVVLEEHRCGCRIREGQRALR